MFKNVWRVRCAQVVLSVFCFGGLFSASDRWLDAGSDRYRMNLSTQHPLERDLESLCKGQMMVVYFSQKEGVCSAKYDVSKETYLVTYQIEHKTIVVCIPPLAVVLDDEFLQGLQLKPGCQHAPIGVQSCVKKEYLSRYAECEFSSLYLKKILRKGLNVLEKCGKTEVCQFGKPLCSEIIKDILPWCKARLWTAMGQGDFVRLVKESGFVDNDVFIVVPDKGVLKGRCVKSVTPFGSFVPKDCLYAHKMRVCAHRLNKRYPFSRRKAKCSLLYKKIEKRKKKRSTEGETTYLLEGFEEMETRFY